MQKKQITVTVDDNGNVRVQVKGVEGKACVGLTDDLLKNLGAVRKQTKTPEYYQEPVPATTHVHSK